MQAQIDTATYTADVKNILEQGKIVPTEVQQQLNDRLKSVLELMEKYQKPEELGSDQAAKIYEESNEKWKDYTNFLLSIKYNMTMTGEAFHYMRDLILKDNSYDENSIFIAYKVKDNFFAVVDQMKISRDDNSYDIPVTINDISLIHHLIKHNTVKGINKKADLFKDVLLEIGRVSKVFAVWNAESEETSKQIYNWTKGLREAEEATETVKAEVLEPNKAE